MRAFGRKRLLTLALLGGAALVSLLWQGPAYAGGPLAVGGTFGTPGEPVVWDTASPVSYHTDQGNLGTLDTAAADQLVGDGFDVWANVPTATIAFQRDGDLGQDVNGSNQMSFFDSFLNCQQPSSFTNAIVYDDDGAITEDIIGVGQSKFVLGFAGAVCIDPVNGRLTRGRAVLNGLFTDGQPNPGDPLPNKFKEVFTHEFGHLIGLDHSQVNVDVLVGNTSADNLFGLPLMFPILLSSTPARVDNGFPALAPDDDAWISFLYPSAIFASEFGRITGHVLFSDGITPLQGGNVIARQENDVGTPEDESRRFAVSVVSGFRFTGNPGQSVTGTNPGSDFGSRDPSDIGTYEIPLRPGNYTVEVESINAGFTEGSSLGPLGADAGEQFPLPGPPEFWNMGESNSDSSSASDLITVIANGEESGRDIILNGTPSRFDTFESARLWLREPAPAWVRREIPFDSMVAG